MQNGNSGLHRRPDATTPVDRRKIRSRCRQKAWPSFLLSSSPAPGSTDRENRGCPGYDLSPLSRVRLSTVN